jgi:hypothetical protein
MQNLFLKEDAFMGKRMLLFFFFVCFIFSILVTGCPPPDPGPEPTPEPTDDPGTTPTLTPTPTSTPTSPLIIQKLIRTYNAGSDTLWFTSDDQITAIESCEDFDGYSYNKSKQFSHPGPDSDWTTFDDNNVIGYYWNRIEHGGHWCYNSGPNGIWFDWDDSFYEYNSYLADRTEQYGNPGGDNFWFTDDDILTSYEGFTANGDGVRIQQVYYDDPGTDQVWFTADDVIGLTYYGAYANFSGNTEPGLADNWTLGIFYNSPGPDSTWFTSDDVIDHICERDYDGIHDYSSDWDNWAQEIRYNGPGSDGIWLTEDDVIENYRVKEFIEGTSVPTPTSVPPDPPISLAEDSYEEDDDYTTANEILYETDATGTYDQFHSISPSEDEDWLYFSANNGDTYIIEMYPVQGGISFDSYLELYDTDGTTLLDEDDSGGTGSYSMITWTCPATGTYYIRTYDDDNYYEGHYMIYVVHLVSGIIHVEIQ